MTVINAAITGFCAGNDLDVNRTVPGVPASQTIAKAWLTLKAKLTDADPGLLQKAILQGAVAGQGQITDVGSAGTAQLLFQLSGTETLALPADTPDPIRHQGEDVGRQTLHDREGHVPLDRASHSSDRVDAIRSRSRDGDRSQVAGRYGRARGLDRRALQETPAP
jgi:hypothetical protein